MTKGFAVVDRHGDIWHSKFGGLAIFLTERAATAFMESLDRPAINEYKVQPVGMTLQKSSDKVIAK